MEMQIALKDLGKSIIEALLAERLNGIDKIRFSLGHEVEITPEHYLGQNLESLGLSVMEHYFAFSMKLETSLKKQEVEISFMAQVFSRGRKALKEDTFLIELSLEVQKKLLDFELEEA